MESSGQMELWYDLGRWDEITSGAVALLSPDRDDVDPQSRIFCRIVAGDVAIWRDEIEVAREVVRGLEQEVMITGESQLIVAALDLVAHLAVAAGKIDAAEHSLRELESHPNVRDAWNFASYLPEIVRLSCFVLDVDFAERFTVGIPPSAMERAGVSMAMARAELAEAREELEAAADLYASAEQGLRTFSVPELAQALLGRGRCLLELGDPWAVEVLRESRHVFASLHANRFTPEVDALLERALPLSS